MTKYLNTRLLVAFPLSLLLLVALLQLSPLHELGKIDLDLDGHKDTIYIRVAPSPVVAYGNIKTEPYDVEVSMKVKGKIVGWIRNVTSLGLEQEFTFFNQQAVERRLAIIARGKSYWAIEYPYSHCRSS